LSGDACRVREKEGKSKCDGGKEGGPLFGGDWVHHELPYVLWEGDGEKPPGGNFGSSKRRLSLKTTPTRLEGGAFGRVIVTAQKGVWGKRLEERKIPFLGKNPRKVIAKGSLSSRKLGPRPRLRVEC